MRIAVLAYNLRVAGGLSVGKNLVEKLPQVAPEHEFLFIVPDRVGYPTRSRDRQVCVHTVWFSSAIQRLIFEKFKMPTLINQFAPDLILGLGNFGLNHPPCKQAFLFHKPHLIYSKKHYEREIQSARIKNWFLKKKVAACLPTTQRVFCQTPVAKKRFAETFAYPLDQIKIMPNAVSEFSKVDPKNITMPEVFKSNKCFTLFYLTKYYAHKNLEILIELFRQYSDILKDCRCIVTVAPDQHPHAPAFLEKLEKYNLTKQIVNVGPLQQEELAGYFLHSDALIFPTLLESFSGTYLEAMHFGLPILTSDLDFAHYVCDDCAIYFDPWNPAVIADKIVQLKDSTILQQQLRDKGRKRIDNFFSDWNRIAADVIRECESIV